MFGPVQGTETEGSVTLEVRELEGGGVKGWGCKVYCSSCVHIPNATTNILKYGDNF